MGTWEPERSVGGGARGIHIRNMWCFCSGLKAKFGHYTLECENPCGIMKNTPLLCLQNEFQILNCLPRAEWAPQSVDLLHFTFPQEHRDKNKGAEGSVLLCPFCSYKPFPSAASPITVYFLNPHIELHLGYLQRKEIFVIITSLMKQWEDCQSHRRKWWETGVIWMKMVPRDSYRERHY